MTTIQTILETYQMSFQNVVLMHVYVKDLGLFARMNVIYGEYFSVNPAPRFVLALLLALKHRLTAILTCSVTVQGMLADGQAIQIDCLAVATLMRREYMHVQSISYWAPANIGYRVL